MLRLMCASTSTPSSTAPICRNFATRCFIKVSGSSFNNSCSPRTCSRRRPHQTTLQNMIHEDSTQIMKSNVHLARR
ncbi:hypothetical protein Mapa_014924 [Marchantia paleacea]|nr:hypothetical protein Mapa_014924 [Marchantia paleacea]